MRSFAHELGRMLGCGACLEALRRTRSGSFGLPGAVPLDELAAPDAATALASRVIPCDQLLPDYPTVPLKYLGRA